MTILLGADHAGFALRRILADWLIARGYAVSEVGATGESAFDYPDAAIAVAAKIASDDSLLGVLVCGTGIGMAIAANKIRGVRAAVCWNEDSARLSREHNHANILCLGARLIDPTQATQCLEAFLSATPSDEARHIRRISKFELADRMEPETAGCSRE